MTGNKGKDKCLKKSNLLVYQQPTGKRVERKDDCRGKRKIPICTPKPKHIKVCTGAELRKMCPPNVCPCEPVKKSKFGFLRLLGFGLKCAAAAAAVFVSYDMGVWGTTDDTQDLYGTACTMFSGPRPKKNDKWDPPSCEAESELFSRGKFNPYAHCEDPPIQAETTYLKFKNCWNTTVAFVFSGIAGFPFNLMPNGDRGAAKKANEPVCEKYQSLDPEEQERISNQYKTK